MFITERLISLFVYTLTLALACGLTRRIVNKQNRIIILGYLVILCLFSFFYKPYITADLWRLREYMEWWIHMSANEVITYSLRSSNPTWILYSWLLRKLNNINWLQTVTCLWTFGNAFYIVIHEIERTRASGKNRSLILFYVMAIGALFLQTISGIRTMLGISIVTFCFYRETVERKSLWKHTLLYLFAALLHSAVMALVISRFLFLVLQYKEPAKKAVMLLIVLLLGTFAAYYLWDYISGSFEYVQRYLLNRNEYTYIWEILIGIIESVETIYILYQYRKRFRYDPKTISLAATWLFCLVWTVISLIALPFSYAIFRRYTILCSLVSIPLLNQLLLAEEDQGKDSFFRVIRMLSFLVFAISGVRGDLCGYKFFEL